MMFGQTHRLSSKLTNTRWRQEIFSWGLLQRLTLISGAVQMPCKFRGHCRCAKEGRRWRLDRRSPENHRQKCCGGLAQITLGMAQNMKIPLRQIQIHLVQQPSLQAWRGGRG